MQWQYVTFHCSKTLLITVLIHSIYCSSYCSVITIYSCIVAEHFSALIKVFTFNHHFIVLFSMVTCFLAQLPTNILPTKNVNAASFHIVNRNESLLMQLDFEVQIGFLFARRQLKVSLMRSSYLHVGYFLRRRWYMHILDLLYLSNYPINCKTWLIIVSGEQLFGQQYTKPSIKGTIILSFWKLNNLLHYR